MELYPSPPAAHIATAFGGISDVKPVGSDQEWTVYIFDC